MVLTPAMVRKLRSGDYEAKMSTEVDQVKTTVNLLGSDVTGPGSLRSPR